MGTPKGLARPADYLSILKLRIMALLVFVAGVTATVAGGGDIRWGRISLLALSGGLACLGSSLLNNYLDRDIDSLMPRTVSRALPQGKISPTIVLFAGLALVAVSLPIAWQLNWLVALLVLSGALVYVVIYTMWLKRRSAWNIVIGGLAGGCAALAGWFAVTTQVSLTPFLIALMVFLWTPSHFWSFALTHQESYRKAGVPMLPVVAGRRRTVTLILFHSIMLVVASLLLYFLGPLNVIYLAGSLLFGGIFLISSVWMWRSPRRKLDWSTYKLSGLCLLGLFVFMLLDVIM